LGSLRSSPKHFARKFGYIVFVISFYELTMIAVIFEVTPNASERTRYFEIAASLRDELSAMDGFISVERFQSITTPDKFLSLSFWRDEQAVAAWRQRTNHRAAQHTGRTEVFADYRLRVASVVRDYGMTERAQAPQDSQSVHSSQLKSESP
jgi:heme-degrading monooxygenase HmoA